MYANGELERFFYTIQLDNNHTVEFTYDSNNFLIKKEKTTIDGEYKTIVTTDYDEETEMPGIVAHTDTWIYRNGKEIERVSESGIYYEKTKWTTTYDDRGNRIKEVEEMWWSE
jgi:hypothetical protein